jgi:hypothetical protein
MWLAYTVQEGIIFYLSRSGKTHCWTSIAKEAEMFRTQREMLVAIIVPRLIMREHGEMEEIHVGKVMGDR